MRFIPSLKLLLLTSMVALIAVFGVSCSDDDSEHIHGPEAGSVSVHFDHQVDGADLVVDIAQFLYTNAAGNNYSVDRLRYFVSDIALHKANGSIYGVDDVHYRDATDNGTRTWMIDGVPSGTYTAVSFTFGVPADKNMSGAPIINIPGVAGMEWPPNWGGGWHYMILEGRYKESGTGTEYGYRTHSGRRNVTDGSGMPPGPDTFPYHHTFRVTLSLANSFVVDGDDWQIRTIMNVNGWYEDPMLDLESLFPQGSGGIMVNLSVQQQIQANGPACYSITPAVKQ